MQFKGSGDSEHFVFTVQSFSPAKNQHGLSNPIDRSSLAVLHSNGIGSSKGGQENGASQGGWEKGSATYSAAEHVALLLIIAGLDGVLQQNMLPCC